MVPLILHIVRKAASYWRQHMQMMSNRMCLRLLRAEIPDYYYKKLTGSQVEISHSKLGFEEEVLLATEWPRPRRYVRVHSDSAFAHIRSSRPPGNNMLGKFVSPVITVILLIWTGAQLFSRV